MTDIVDDDVIRLAKWHENEAVRLRKHPDADMSSTHGLAEMHGETASTLYMLLADRNAATMDADLQAREAGNMEFNTRVLMAARDRLQKIVQDLLSVMPVLPAAAKHIVGMEDRYNSAITNARTALKKMRHD